jgi:hypothetical protein
LAMAAVAATRRTARNNGVPGTDKATIPTAPFSTSGRAH